VTLTLNTEGHGPNTTQTLLLGEAPTQPADPTASGFVFKGWFTNAGLTDPADFTLPLDASTTFFAKFTPILAVTGDTINPYALPLAVGGLGVGLVLVALRRRRTGQPG
jgi:uncharacterized repeat protein (TIGR02543 family)